MHTGTKRSLLITYKTALLNKIRQGIIFKQNVVLVTPNSLLERLFNLQIDNVTPLEEYKIIWIVDVLLLPMKAIGCPA